ncbi:hypothetical protein K7H91_06010 [Martelella mediterranea]|uniref:hypothetical protein n=1 Tax=Martelella mediterranea TaxID=293089 RepID=UPI001E2C0D21|nr:hypothetical protein [Martelella mediterranea]MCD1633321.1 hypothetical protein [Martelella mediterranea]
MSLLSRIFAFLARDDEDALSVPPMDGVYKPNSLLDAAERVITLPAIDNLAVSPSGLYCSSGGKVLRVDPRGGSHTLVHAFDGQVSMLAAAANGDLAAAVENIGVMLLRPSGETVVLDLPDDFRSCVTAGLFESDDQLLLAIGSLKNPVSDWKRDLMSHGDSGQIVRHTISSGATDVLSTGLRFPYGIVRLDDGAIAVTESWRHRIVRIDDARTLLDELPAYPARLTVASGGGFWLALFGPRRQLTEFVLREDDYRREMMATIAPEAWIGPDFADASDEEQPLQSGSVRQMGVMKPWAPSRSYGLVVRLDADMRPVASYHSRADGTVHGIASIAEYEGALYAASRGGGALVRLDLKAGAKS